MSVTMPPRYDPGPPMAAVEFWSLEVGATFDRWDSAFGEWEIVHHYEKIETTEDGENVRRDDGELLRFGSSAPVRPFRVSR